MATAPLATFQLSVVLLLCCCYAINGCQCSDNVTLLAELLVCSDQEQMLLLIALRSA